MGSESREEEDSPSTPRPLLRHLQQHQSTSQLAFEDHPSQAFPRRPGSSVRSRKHFASPDRFIPQRPLHVDKRSTYQTSKPPVLLQGRERNTRKRDDTVNPFRSISETRSRNLSRQRQSQNVYNLRPPHYIPSFVHGRDVTPGHVEERIATEPLLRRISIGFWAVGGRLSVQVGQLQGIISGTGGLLASGTTAPMHTAAFLDQASLDDKIVAHERRVALALDIDQSSRILLPNSGAESPAVSLRPDHTPFIWKDSAWTQDGAAGCRLCLRE